MTNLQPIAGKFRYESGAVTFDIFYSPGGGSLSGGTYPRGVFGIICGKQPVIQLLLLPLDQPDPAKVEEVAARLDEAAPEIARRFAAGFTDAARELLRDTAEAVK